LNFEITDIWVIAAVVGLAVIGFAVFRLRKRQETRASGRQFLGMGIVWLLIGLAYSLWRGDNLFDIGLFNLGLIFTIAGLFQLAIEKYKRRSQ
jgi:amino acid transporter